MTSPVLLARNDVCNLCNKITCIATCWQPHRADESRLSRRLGGARSLTTSVSTSVARGPPPRFLLTSCLLPAPAMRCIAPAAHRCSTRVSLRLSWPCRACLQPPLVCLACVDHTPCLDSQHHKPPHTNTRTPLEHKIKSFFQKPQSWPIVEERGARAWSSLAEVLSRPFLGSDVLVAAHLNLEP